MSDTIKLVANQRESFGKGAARKLRVAGQTPAVVYGHGSEVQHISVDAHAISLIVRRTNALINLDFGKKKQLVLVRDIQRDPVRQIIEHLDMVIVKKGETVLVDIPVQLIGTAFSGHNALLELNSLSLHVPAAAIPEVIEIDIEGLQDGARFLVKDIELPEGAIAEHEEDQLVAYVEEQRAVEEETATEEVDEASEEEDEDSESAE